MLNYKEFVLKENITEPVKKEPSSKAAKQARALGLQYVGFGRYENTKTGTITHIVVGDQLRSVGKKDKDPEIIYNHAKKALDDHTQNGNPKDKEFKKTREQLEQEHDKAKKGFEDYKEKSKNHIGNHLISKVDREAKQWLQKNQKEAKENDKALQIFYDKANYSKEELHGIKEYSDELFFDINKYLYANKGEVDFRQRAKTNKGSRQFEVMQAIAEIDSAMEKSTAPYEFHAYSGLDDSYDISGLERGKQYIFTGYRSTSIDFEKAGSRSADQRDKKGAAVLQIKVPTGARGMYIGHLSSRKDEKEFLLPRNSKIKIVGKPRKLNLADTQKGYRADYGLSDLTVIEAELVPDKDE
jgi:hypothetical protein